MRWILLLSLAASCQASCLRDQELEEADMLQQEPETVTLYDVETFRRLRVDTEEDDDNPTPAVGIIFY